MHLSIYHMHILSKIYSCDIFPSPMLCIEVRASHLNTAFVQYQRTNLVCFMVLIYGFRLCKCYSHIFIFDSYYSISISVVTCSTFWTIPNSYQLIFLFGICVPITGINPTVCKELVYFYQLLALFF